MMEKEPSSVLLWINMLELKAKLPLVGMLRVNFAAAAFFGFLWAYAWNISDVICIVAGFGLSLMMISLFYLVHRIGNIQRFARELKRIAREEHKKARLLAQDQGHRQDGSHL